MSNNTNDKPASLHSPQSDLARESLKGPYHFSLAGGVSRIFHERVMKHWR